MNAMTLTRRLSGHRPRCDEPLTDIAFCAWIAQALPGEILEYHRGLIAIDRNAEISKLGADESERIDHLADRAFAAAEIGLVHLLQQRIALNDYRYLAVARPRPAEATNSLFHLLLENEG